MALLIALALLAVVVLVWKQLNKKDKVPTGLKPLPGPKGKVVCCDTRPHAHAV